MIRQITQLHENNRLVSIAQTPAGRLLIWLVAILLLAWHHSNPLMFAAFSLVMLWPLKRRILLSLAAAGMVIDGISIPRAEIGLLEGTGRWSWGPGPGRLWEAWESGEHTALVSWNRIGSGRSDPGSFTWVFRVA